MITDINKNKLSFLDLSYFFFMASVPIEMIAMKGWDWPFSLAFPFGGLFVFLYFASPLGKSSFRIPWQMVLPMVYLFICLFHYFFAYNFQFIGDIASIFNNIAFSIVLYNYLTHRKNIKIGLLAMGGVTLCCSFLIFLSAGMSILDVDRFTVLDFDQNNFGSVLGLGALIIITTSYSNKFSCVIFCISCVMMISTLALIVASGSRGAMIAFVLTLTLYIYINLSISLLNTRKIIFIIIVIVSSTYFVANCPLTLERWHYTIQGDEVNAFSMRDTLFLQTLHMIIERPLAGWGIRDGYWELGQRVGFAYIGVHNTFLQIALSTGFLGALPFFVFFVFPIIKFKIYKNSNTYKQLVVLYLYILIVFLSVEWINRKQLWIFYAMMLSTIDRLRVVSVSSWFNTCKITRLSSQVQQLGCESIKNG